MTAGGERQLVRLAHFPIFRETIITRSRTRIFAFLNIVGNGMRGVRFEREEPLRYGSLEPTAGNGDEKQRHDNRQHQDGALRWARTSPPSTLRAVEEAGKLADIPVMDDFGRVSSQKTFAELVTEKLRPRRRLPYPRLLRSP